MPVNRVARWGAVVLLLMAGITLAEELLSKEFLEYLADFETDSGEWLDPEELEVMASLNENNQQPSEVSEDE